MSAFAGVGATKETLLREIFARFEAVLCPGCQERMPPDRLTKHHIMPRSEGGPTVLDNLVLLCRDCHTDLHRGYGETIRQVRKFIRPRGRFFPFPPPPEPLSPEEAVRLFLLRMNARAARVLNHHRFSTNPPFDPEWPVGRHFAPSIDDGYYRFVSPLA